jgi:hypothetical protein
MGISLLPASMMELARPGVTYRVLPEHRYVPLCGIWQEEDAAPTLAHLLTTTRQYCGPWSSDP